MKFFWEFTVYKSFVNPPFCINQIWPQYKAVLIRILTELLENYNSFQLEFFICVIKEIKDKDKKNSVTTSLTTKAEENGKKFAQILFIYFFGKFSSLLLCDRFFKSIIF